MRLLQVVRQRFKARVELTRARMQMRGLLDYELVGRYCGLLLFPFVLYFCCGSMQSYAEDRVTDALQARADTKRVPTK